MSVERGRIASIRDTPNSKDEPWSEFIDFARKLEQDIGPLFGRDAALVAEYARSLEEQLEAQRPWRLYKRMTELEEQSEALRSALIELLSWHPQLPQVREKVMHPQHQEAVERAEALVGKSGV